MNWEFIEEVLPLYQKAAVLTVKIGLAGIILSILIGLACAAIQNYRIPVISQIISVYIEISRNTPLLIQLFFIYYGLPKIGIQTNPEICGVAGLAFLGGSYMAEAFRSGIDAIEPIQIESAYSLGLDQKQTFLYVAQRDKCFLGDQPYGSDVYCKGSDRSVLPDDRESFSAGGLLPVDPASGVPGREPAGEEAALRRIRNLIFYSSSRNTRDSRRRIRTHKETRAWGARLACGS